MELKIKVNIRSVNGILVIEVPRGTNKPYACSEGVYLRFGANSQKLTRNEIIEMFQREGLITFDALENTRAKFDTDFDLTAYKQFLLKAKMSDTLKPMQMLLNLRCMTNNGHFTNAGVLFFTKSIEFLILQAKCTCVLYKGIDKIKILDRKDYCSNMLDNIDNAVKFVQRHTNLEYKIEHIQREEIPEIPEIALREAIINAFDHRYYFEQGSNIIVEVYDDRVMITSFGGLPAGLSESDFGKRSVPRNPIITDLLQRVSYIKKVGTGIKRIKDSVEALGKGTVEFKYSEHWFDVIFSRQLENKVQNKVHKVQNKVQDSILTIISNTPRVSINDMAEHLSLSVRTIKTNIAQLKENGVIERIGSKKPGSGE